MNEESFLRGLLDNSEDDELRLVYSDWLDERDDVRGEFLRLAVALRKAKAEDPALPRLRKRIQELRSAVPAEWLVQAFRAYAEDDVREAVLSHLLGDNPCLSNFIQVDGRLDPSWYLLDRLEATVRQTVLENLAEREGADGRAIKPASAEAAGEPDDRGPLFLIEALRWLAEDHCEVDAGAVYGPLAGHGVEYQVRLQKGRWTVVDIRGTWIS
jgi:uncharacterized protein (TIGR02996 family)